MLNIALRAARIASENLARALERLDLIQSEGQDVNKFVAETCERAEQSIARTIVKAYPQHAIYGRQSGKLHTAEQSSREQHIDTEWHILPLDGWLNYSRGLPNFCLALIAKQKGKVEHALVINPMTGEEFTASRGRGAQLNGRRIRVGKVAQLDGALIGHTFDNSISNRHLLTHFLDMQKQLLMSNANLHHGGSPLLEMANLAAGRLDAVVLLNLNELELEAGAMLLQECGALLGDIQGNPSYRQRGHLLAANAKLFKQIVQQLQNVSLS